jgi:pyrroline-5-carboxylate reductase
MLDVVTAVSGNGPAYVFYLIELMEKAGLELGLSIGQAKLLARQTLVGSGKYLQQTDAAVEELRAKVTSKGGTTEAAFAVLEQPEFKEMFTSAVRAAWEKSKELGS